MTTTTAASRWLASLGHHIVAAALGRASPQVLAAADFALILLDVVMPGGTAVLYPVSVFRVATDRVTQAESG
ncbi:hypothetical protein [Streptomyces chryseus]